MNQSSMADLWDQNASAARTQNRMWLVGEFVAVVVVVVVVVAAPAPAAEALVKQQ